MDLDVMILPDDIKPEEDQKVFIELDLTSSDPDDIVIEWDLDVRRMFSRYAIINTEADLDDLMKEYVVSIAERAVYFENIARLITMVEKHIALFFNMSQDYENGYEQTYLDRMENILTFYVNAHMRALLKTRRLSKLTPEALSKKAAIIVQRLSVYLLQSEYHIFHVLIRQTASLEDILVKDVSNITNSNVCRHIFRELYRRFLVSEPLQDVSDESFCRTFILFENWKEFEDHKQDHKINQCIKKIYNKGIECIETNAFLKKILRPKVSLMKQLLLEVGGCNVSITEAYFEYIRSVKNDVDIKLSKDKLMNSSISLWDNDDDASYRDLFDKMVGSSKLIDFEDEGVYKEHHFPAERTVSNAVIIEIDSDSDSDVEIVEITPRPRKSFLDSISLERNVDERRRSRTRSTSTVPSVDRSTDKIIKLTDSIAINDDCYDDVERIENVDDLCIPTVSDTATTKECLSDGENRFSTSNNLTHEAANSLNVQERTLPHSSLAVPNLTNAIEAAKQNSFLEIPLLTKDLDNQKTQVTPEIASIEGELCSIGIHVSDSECESLKDKLVTKDVMVSNGNEELEKSARHNLIVQSVQTDQESQNCQVELMSTDADSAYLDILPVGDRVNGASFLEENACNDNPKVSNDDCSTTKELLESNANGLVNKKLSSPSSSSTLLDTGQDMHLDILDTGQSNEQEDLLQHENGPPSDCSSSCAISYPTPPGSDSDDYSAEHSAPKESNEVPVQPNVPELQRPASAVEDSFLDVADVFNDRQVSVEEILLLEQLSDDERNATENSNLSCEQTVQGAVESDEGDKTRDVCEEMSQFLNDCANGDISSYSSSKRKTSPSKPKLTKKLRINDVAEVKIIESSWDPQTPKQSLKRRNGFNGARPFQGISKCLVSPTEINSIKPYNDWKLKVESKVVMVKTSQEFINAWLAITNRTRNAAPASPMNEIIYKIEYDKSTLHLNSNDRKYCCDSSMTHLHPTDQKSTGTEIADSPTTTFSPCLSPATSDSSVLYQDIERALEIVESDGDNAQVDSTVFMLSDHADFHSYCEILRKNESKSDEKVSNDICQELTTKSFVDIQCGENLTVLQKIDGYSIEIMEHQDNVCDSTFLDEECIDICVDLNDLSSVTDKLVDSSFQVSSSGNLLESPSIESNLEKTEIFEYVIEECVNDDSVDVFNSSSPSQTYSQDQSIKNSANVLNSCFDKNLCLDKQSVDSDVLDSSSHSRAFSQDQSMDDCVDVLNTQMLCQTVDTLDTSSPSQVSAQDQSVDISVDVHDSPYIQDSSQNQCIDTLDCSENESKDDTDELINVVDFDESSQLEKADRECHFDENIKLDPEVENNSRVVIDTEYSENVEIEMEKIFNNTVDTIECSSENISAPSECSQSKNLSFYPIVEVKPADILNRVSSFVVAGDLPESNSNTLVELIPLESSDVVYNPEHFSTTKLDPVKNDIPFDLQSNNALIPAEEVSECDKDILPSPPKVLRVYRNKHNRKVKPAGIFESLSNKLHELYDTSATVSEKNLLSYQNVNMDTAEISVEAMEPVTKRKKRRDKTRVKKSRKRTKKISDSVPTLACHLKCEDIVSTDNKKQLQNASPQACDNFAKNAETEPLEIKDTRTIKRSVIFRESNGEWKLTEKAPTPAEQISNLSSQTNEVGEKMSVKYQSSSHKDKYVSDTCDQLSVPFTKVEQSEELYTNKPKDCNIVIQSCSESSSFVDPTNVMWKQTTTQNPKNYIDSKPLFEATQSLRAMSLDVNGKISKILSEKVEKAAENFQNCIFVDRSSHVPLSAFHNPIYVNPPSCRLFQDPRLHNPILCSPSSTECRQSCFVRLPLPQKWLEELSMRKSSPTINYIENTCLTNNFNPSYINSKLPQCLETNLPQTIGTVTPDAMPLQTGQTAHQPTQNILIQNAYIFTPEPTPKPTVRKREKPPKVTKKSSEKRSHLQNESSKPPQVLQTAPGIAKDNTGNILPMPVPQSFDFESDTMKNDLSGVCNLGSPEIDIDFETHLPLKKRKLSLPNDSQNAQSKEISYPATPMLSIAEVYNPSRPFKTPAEKKQLPVGSGFIPYTVPYQLRSSCTPFCPPHSAVYPPQTFGDAN